MYSRCQSERTGIACWSTVIGRTVTSTVLYLYPITPLTTTTNEIMNYNSDRWPYLEKKIRSSKPSNPRIPNRNYVITDGFLFYSLTSNEQSLLFYSSMIKHSRCALFFIFRHCFPFMYNLFLFQLWLNLFYLIFCLASSLWKLCLGF